MERVSHGRGERVFQRQFRLRERAGRGRAVWWEGGGRNEERNAGSDGRQNKMFFLSSRDKKNRH